MKVVGLLSGGKDSCYNLCHCVAQGHEVVALASLGPEGGKEEIDSYMYQTVGQDGLHFIAQALELPLVRRKIQGTAVDQESDYAATIADRQAGKVEGDETEDLYQLLQEVLKAYPDIQGVSVGAILSNYQRVRVEHVCARLGLQALAYLWQFDRSQLLEDMDNAGMESIIIKVAGAGLGVRHLGMNVCSEEMRDELEILNGRWGTHPAGEGGEYETFTVDCPLFRSSIKLTDTEAVVLSKPMSPRDEFGTVAYLRLKNAELVSKDIDEPALLASLKQRLRVPPLLDDDARRVFSVLDSVSSPDAPSSDELTPLLPHAASGAGPPTQALSKDWLGISEITSPAAEVTDEVKGCFKLALEALSKQGLDITSVAHINLYLSSMSLFPAVNAVYNTFFGPSPPTRACVSAILPEGVNVKMDIIAHTSRAKGARTALHVRGLSYWAPANIGPYSQCVRVGERLFIAGQIGLQPRDLALPSPPSFAQEAALSTQHVRKIVKAMREGTGGGFSGWLESCVCWISGPASTFGAKRDLARLAWRTWTHGQDIPFLIVQTGQLPKGAQIEWQVTWHTGKRVVSGLDDDDVDDDEAADLKAERHSSYGDNESEQSLRSGSSTVTMKLGSSGEVSPIPSGTFSRRIFHTISEVVISHLTGPCTKVQVLNIANMELDEVTLACVDFSED